MKKQVYGDAAYVKKRDALIPKAEQLCDKALGVVDVKSRGQEWTRLFMRTMDRLWKLQYLEERSRFMANELARLNTESVKLSAEAA
jgi:hypothetical protein